MGGGAFLDIQPRRRGHVLVVPEQPAMRLAELDRDQQQALMEGVTVVQSKLTSIFGTKDFSIVIHDGPQAGQEVRSCPHSRDTSYEWRWRTRIACDVAEGE